MHSRTNQSHKIAEFQSNPHIAAAILKAMNDEILSKQDGIYMESYAMMALSMYANQFEHVRAGITVSNWKNSRRAISYYMAIPWIRKWWLEVGNLAQTSDFASEVESIIKEYPGNTTYLDKIIDNDT